MKKTIFAVSLISALFFVTYFLLFPSDEAVMSDDPLIIIDAGHGAPDGGAVAEDGTTEADINLLVAKKIFDILTKNGIDCVMTRSDENSVYTEGDTIHAKKVSDIRNRVKLANDNPGAFLISIHMNTFPSSDVKGAQVFYKTGGEKSKEIAEEIQNIINLKYQSDNTKVVKPIPSNIYLFNHIKNDSVLVECGFLTNQEDLLKLKDREFQSDIAHSISEVVMYKLFRE